MEKGRYKEESRKYLDFLLFSDNQFLVKAVVPSSLSCSSYCFYTSDNLREKVDDSASTITMVGNKELVNPILLIIMQLCTYKIIMIHMSLWFVQTTKIYRVLLYMNLVEV
jgi:hypothetical protein